MLTCEKNEKYKRWTIQTNINLYVAQGSYLLEFSDVFVSEASHKSASQTDADL